MKFYISVVLLIQSLIGWGCECENVDHISMADWNDTELIFSATLVDISRSTQFTKLEFEDVSILKGVAHSRLDVVIENLNDHSLLQGKDKIGRQQRWLIFARTNTVAGNKVYKLASRANDPYCGLSRKMDEYSLHSLSQFSQLTEQSDAQLLFANRQAVGGYMNRQPEGLWRYTDSRESDKYWVGEYEDGKRTGEWYQYYIDDTNEKPQQKLVFEKGQLTQRVTYQPTGAIKTSESYSRIERKRSYFHREQITATWTHNIRNNQTLVQYIREGEVYRQEEGVYDWNQ
jgi:hypothetical protein